MNSHFTKEVGRSCNLRQQGAILLLTFLFYLLLAALDLVALRGLSLAAVSGGYSFLPCIDLLLWLLLQSTASRACRLNGCGSRALPWLGSCSAWGAPCHVGSSWARNQTYVPCTGKWILIHCVTREVQEMLFEIDTVQVLSLAGVEGWRTRGQGALVSVWWWF